MSKSTVRLSPDALILKTPREFSVSSWETPDRLNALMGLGSAGAFETVAQEIAVILRRRRSVEAQVIVEAAMSALVQRIQQHAHWQRVAELFTEPKP